MYLYNTASEVAKTVNLNTTKQRAIEMSLLAIQNLIRRIRFLFHTHTHCLYVVLFVAQLQYLDTNQDKKRSRSLLWMEEAWLWYGPDDPVSLDHVRQASAYIILCHFDGHSQAGAKAVSTALFHLPAGQVI